MYWVYILYSHSTDSYYKGQCNDLILRIERHNNGYEKYTSKGKPWKLVWSIQVDSRSEAVKLEMKLKNLSRKKLIVFMNKYSAGCAGPDVTPRG